MSIDSPLGRRLLVVIGSTRPGRQGDRWGHWVAQIAREHGWEVDVADLAELNLPLFDEPNHPRAHKYTHDHTAAWSATVAAADAYVFVTPEYNYSIPAALKNALDYLATEWKDKPAGIVSYGGISGGLRATHHLLQVFTALGLRAPQGSVPIPFSAQYLTDDGGIDAPESVLGATTAMLGELQRLDGLLHAPA
ncbi:NADPH-dependent FMN reductase [Brachybacterium sp. AOP25-B2-12]|uniref:NADPH-dependent FMN reductase n=1 Tax=Brachybacterium sp. AOP25-B2-12 TaxID=3457710 RepID=UPI004033F945